MNIDESTIFMSLKNVSHEKSEKCYVHNVCGRKSPVPMKGKPIECIETEKNLNYHVGDILIVTFPKTGTTILQYICHLLRTQCLAEHLEFEDIHQVVPHTSSAWFVGQNLNTDQGYDNYIS